MKYVEYIQTDGYCWFDTGILPSIDTSAELSFSPGPKAGDWPVYFGKSWSDWDDTTFTFKSNNDGNAFDARFGNIEMSGFMSFTVWDDYLVNFNNTGITVNGNVEVTWSPSIDSETAHTLWIAAENNTETGGDWDRHRASIAKFYYLKLWENGILIGDFRPAVDDNNRIGFYDEVTSTFKPNLGTGTPVAGPELTSIIVSASKTVLKSTGETISIEVATENAWTLATSGDTFLTLSSTGDTSGTTITAIAPDYSGSTAREEYLTFTDSVTNDSAEIKIKQKKYQAGQPFYLGVDEIAEIYLGSDSISEAYLGEDLVYSSGPFQGLKISPKSFNFNIGSLSASCKVKSSEPWTMTVPAWVTASTLTGDTGETIITLSTTAQTAATSGTVEIATANYSVSASAQYDEYELLAYIENGSYDGSKTTGFSINLGVYPSLTVCAEIVGQISNCDGGSYFGCNNYDAGNNNYFRLFTYNTDTITLDYPTDGERRITKEITFGQPFHLEIGNCYIKDLDNDTIVTAPTVTDGDPVQVNFSLPICLWANSWDSTAELYTGDRFYSVKIWDDKVNGSLIRDLVPAKLGNQVGMWDRVTGQLFTNDMGGTITYGTL